MNTERLSPEGAARLRAVRERFRQHPEQYTNHVWFCETQGCVAGWLLSDAMDAAAAEKEIDALCMTSPVAVPEAAARLLGFSSYCDEHGNSGGSSRVGRLFTGGHYDPPSAIAAIDAFLWTHGFPPDPVDAPAAEPVSVERSA